MGRRKIGVSYRLWRSIDGEIGSCPPISEERQGFVIVTFKAQLVAEGAELVYY